MRRSRRSGRRRRTSSRSKTRSNIRFRASARFRFAPISARRLPTACARSCAKTPTSSWSAKSATMRRRRSQFTPPYRSPRLFDAPHERRCRRGDPTSRYGRRAVSGGLITDRRYRPAARETGLHKLRRAREPSLTRSRAIGITQHEIRRGGADSEGQRLRQVPRHGYEGRQALYELLIIDEPIRRMTVERSRPAS